MISSPSNKMDSEVAFDRSPAFRVYKSGRIERLLGETTVPPSLTPQNGVVSKDVIYSPEKNLFLRIYLPEKVSDITDKKLPILIYFHGGGFIIETAFSPTYHTFLTSAVAAAKCLAISVDYLRAPEFPIPIPYEDSWDSLKWVLTHITGTGPETWINKHGDFGKVFLAGDSAGGNIAHHLTIRAKREKLETVISGIILIHPYFWGKTPIDEFEVRDVGKTKGVEGSWRVASPNSKEGVDDPWLNVVGSKSSDLSGLGCGRVLVLVAGDDLFVRQGWCYAAKLKKSGWEGEVEVMETKNEGHVFHLKNPNTDNARQVVKKLAEFINK
ncbi:probable carboxylesterase 7 [Arabidopsis lyrata subsp. lyrata]|uniref:probable carboxylesterase 7 n=1 Tax=Arabidopsis lyrata subsp. lyrata TaxID=81972 RepID=UPI000A29E850|nr:probable carboxylesterase 7 [Arabidopsis lyrata subsp. lyrata]|eukprot:XP_020882418.1 probable carboxylesterase 7 [Arabidopsis lyrata subsp. lyrata]